MSRTNGNIIFAVAYVVCFVGAILLVTGGHLDSLVASAIAIILGSETVVFAMIYASVYFGANEEDLGIEAKASAKH